MEERERKWSRWDMLSFFRQNRTRVIQQSKVEGVKSVRRCHPGGGHPTRAWAHDAGVHLRSASYDSESDFFDCSVRIELECYLAVMVVWRDRMDWLGMIRDDPWLCVLAFESIMNVFEWFMKEYFLIFNFSCTFLIIMIIELKIVMYWFLFIFYSSILTIFLFVLMLFFIVLFSSL